MTTVLPSSRSDQIRSDCHVGSKLLTSWVHVVQERVIQTRNFGFLPYHWVPAHSVYLPRISSTYAVHRDPQRSTGTGLAYTCIALYLVH